MGASVSTSVQSHLAALRQRHAALETAVEEETARPHPNELSVARMKKEKLVLKDRIAEMEKEVTKLSA